MGLKEETPKENLSNGQRPWNTVHQSRECSKKLGLRISCHELALAKSTLRAREESPIRDWVMPTTSTSS